MKIIKQNITSAIRLSIILLTLNLYSITLTAQDNLYTIYKFADEITDLNNSLLIYKETSGNLQIDEVKTKTFNKHSKKLEKGKSFWAKISIKSEIKEKIDWVFYFTDKRGSDISEIYVFEKDSLIKKTKAGHFEKKLNKEIHKELGSKFLFSTKQSKTYTIYFKIHNFSGYNPSFNLKLQSVKKFNNNINRRNIFQGWLQGILWIMFLYNLFVFIYSREKVYVFYALYILGIAANFFIERGLFIEYFIPNNPILNPYFFIFATGIATATYFQFIRDFLDTKKIMPFWDKAHKYVIWINISVSAILLVVLLLVFNVKIVIEISNYLNLAGLIYGLFFIVYLIKNGNFLSRFFVTGALILAVGTIISLYYLITKTQIGFDPKIFMSIGTIGEILFFSLGLGYRIRLVEKEKQETQDKLIDQLVENEKLQDKVNRELEGKVKERTAEIEQQKEEILAQTENLIKANDILINKKREIENKNEEITQQKNSLEKVFKDTKDSINYASKIQNVILPPTDILESYFNDFFILNKPKEVVSGDFYWYRVIQREDTSYFAFVAGDATGHGVPGALVSMLGISLLNETVNKKELGAANQILEKLREDVKATFRQTKEKPTTRDGFDMAFCVLNLKTYEMQFAGANRPLLIFKKNKTSDNEQFIEIKGDRNPIGIHPREKQFTNHKIQMEKGDKIYLFSDGYPDQLGGEDGRKFYIKKFKELLSDINELPMNEQKNLLEKNLINWQTSGKRKFKQVDDILVMGLEIK